MVCHTKSELESCWCPLVHRYQQHRQQICHRYQQHRRKICRRCKLHHCHQRDRRQFTINTASVVDTGGKFATGVNDTGSKFATGINDTGGIFIYLLTRLLKGVQTKIKNFPIEDFLDFHLKRSYQWKMRGVGKLASVRRWFQTVAIDVCFLFNVAVVFSSKYFRFLFAKPK